MYDDVNENNEPRNEIFRRSHHQPARNQHQYQDSECENRERREEYQNQYSYNNHTYQTCGHTPRPSTHTNQYRDPGQLSAQYNTYQRQDQNPRCCPTQQSFYGQYQYQNTQMNQSRNNDLKLIADKIKSMETLIRAKELKYEENTSPRQWIQNMTETCEEQNVIFEDRLELLKVALTRKKEWIKQNIQSWNNWEEVEKAFKKTFCKAKGYTETLQ
ncbi:hypothetical protein KQX54_014047 [Cotesia glomerata]|uniref:Uncharacterized protein n=1 Tax=Cotesia glomerata TaxID=32391 RepID=A0AAV7J1R7_COTGL|nr:hypothetical protein KQX54_014047 [Cotesia glomerata]